MPSAHSHCTAVARCHSADLHAHALPGCALTHGRIEEPPLARVSAKQLSPVRSTLSYSSNYLTACVKTLGPASQLGSPRGSCAQERAQLVAASPSLAGKLPQLHSLLNPTKRPISAVPEPATWCPSELLPAHLTPSMSHVPPAPSHWELGKLLVSVRRLLEAQRNAEEAASAQAKSRERDPGEPSARVRCASQLYG